MTHEVHGAQAVKVHVSPIGPEDGESVVFSHALGNNKHVWYSQYRALSAHGYRALPYDHRGHGASPVPPGLYTIEDLGRDVLVMLDRLGVARAHFVGLSLGGMTGMWLAAHAPERVRSLVLCCTSAKLGPPQRWAQRAQAVREGGTKAIAPVVASRWVTPDYAERFPTRMAALEREVADTPDAGYIGCCAAIEHMDLLAELPLITAPTLVVAGARDLSTPPEHGERIAERIPGARLEVVEGAAHLGTHEQPQRFTELILEHVKRAS